MNARRATRHLVERKGFTLCENSNQQLSLLCSRPLARKASTRKANRAAKTRSAAINNSNNPAVGPARRNRPHRRRDNTAVQPCVRRKGRTTRRTRARRIRANRAAAAVRNRAAAARPAKVPAEAAKARHRATRIRARAVLLRASRLPQRLRRAVRTMRLSPTLRRRAGCPRKGRLQANRHRRRHKERLAALNLRAALTRAAVLDDPGTLKAG